MSPLAFGRLQELQDIDLQLDALRDEVKHIEAALADHGEIERARANLATLTKKQDQASAALRDAELALATLTDEVDQKTKRLYSGTVVSSRELEALQADIAQLTQQRGAREEQALIAMVTAEEAESARHEQQTHLAALETSFAAQEREFSARLQALATEIPAREAERAAVLRQNERMLVTPYQSLRTRLGGRVLVGVSQGRCTFCHIALPDTQLRRAQQNQEIVYCDNCGRLLFTT